MLFEKKVKDYDKHYPYDEDFEVDREEDLIPLYFVDNGVRKGRIAIETHLDHSVTLWSVKIYEQYRKKGFGKQMLNGTLEYIKTKLCETKKIKLYVYTDNEIAIALYKKVGFAIVEQYSDDCLMEKNL